MGAPYKYVVAKDVCWPYMDAARINSNELAALCYVTPNYMSQVTGGKRSPGPQLREAMARALRVTEDELFKRIPKASAPPPGRKRVERESRHRRKPRPIKPPTRKRPRARKRVATGRVYPEVPQAGE